MTFNEMVADWLRKRHHSVRHVTSVEGDGSDYAGDTEGGFYPSFTAYVHWVDDDGKSRSFGVEGEDMVSLWKHMVGAWPEERATNGEKP